MPRSPSAPDRLQSIADVLGLPVEVFFDEPKHRGAQKLFPLGPEMLTALIAAEIALTSGATGDQRAKARTLVRDVLNKTEAD